MIRLTIPGQPQGKGRAKIVKIGGFSRMATPEKTVAYEGLIAYAGQAAMAGRAPIEGPVEVRMFIACQIPQSKSQKWKRDALAGVVVPTTKPDIDNVVKAVFDGLNGVVWKDDVQVVDLVLKKRYSAQPRVEVEVVPVGDRLQILALGTVDVDYSGRQGDLLAANVTTRPIDHASREAA